MRGPPWKDVKPPRQQLRDLACAIRLHPTLGGWVDGVRAAGHPDEFVAVVALLAKRVNMPSKWGRKHRANAKYLAWLLKAGLRILRQDMRRAS
jgi:hypothetical protein